VECWTTRLKSPRSFAKVLWLLLTGTLSAFQKKLIQSLAQALPPNKSPERKSFMGPDSVYPRFIKGCAQIATPLTKVTIKKLPHVPWTVMLIADSTCGSRMDDAW